MADVAEKPTTARRAVATAFVRTDRKARQQLVSGTVPKGDVFATARVAGVLAAKRTSELIPLCHPVTVTRVEVELDVEADGVAVRATVEALDRTGVEMEALTAASVAALTAYDMLKPIDREMVIERVQLESKSGGRSGDFKRNSVRRTAKARQRV
jgi:cyclic pyranopterin phosphate synthase